MAQFIALLDNTWVQRGGSASFLLGLVWSIWRIVSSASPTALAIGLMVVGIAVMVAPHAAAWLKSKKKSKPAPKRLVKRKPAASGAFPAFPKLQAPRRYLGESNSPYRGALAKRLRETTGTRSTREAIAQIERNRLVNDAQGELIVMVDELREIQRQAITPPGYGPLKIWRDKATEFLSSVFGELERQRYESNKGAAPTRFEEIMQRRMDALEELRDRPETWKFKVTREGLQAAIEKRGTYDIGDQIVVSGSVIEGFIKSLEPAPEPEPGDLP